MSPSVHIAILVISVSHVCICSCVVVSQSLILLVICGDFFTAVYMNRAAIDYEKKMHASNLEYSQAMEKHKITVTSEIEKLHAELANARKRARAAVAATAPNNLNHQFSAATPSNSNHLFAVPVQLSLLSTS